MTRLRAEKPTHIKKSSHSVLLRIILALFFLFLIGAIVVAFGSYQRFRKNFTEKNIVIVPKSIDGFKGNIILAHISPNTHKIETFEFPGSSQIDVAGGYGMYSLASIYPMLLLDKKSPEFVRSVLSLSLHVPIDEVWVSTIPSDIHATTDFKNIAQLIVKSRIQTPLLGLDKLWFYFYVQGNSGHITSRQLKDAEQWQSMKNGTTLTTLPATDRECSVAVFNVSEEAGIGSKVGTFLESSGYTIIRVTDQPLAQGASDIITTVDEKCSSVVTHLRHILPGNPLPTFHANVMNEYRANVAIRVGKDLSALFKKK